MRSPTAEWYRRAATRDLVGHSARHAEWAAGIADDDELLGRLDDVPEAHRQPSLVCSVAAYLGAPDAAYATWRAWVLEHWPAIAAELPRRRTQTNEVGRCAPLVLALAEIEGPIALLELGAAAGLCLLPDRYGYRFDGGALLGGGPVRIDCALSGLRAPERLPEIVWRRGIDLQPRSVLDPEDVRWLEALVPPDRPDRLARLRAAVEVARPDPPVVEPGDALADLDRVAALAPRDATLVVAALGTLVYLPRDARAAIREAVASRSARFATFEAAGIADRGEDPPAPFVLALDGVPLAAGAPHGDRLLAVR